MLDQQQDSRIAWVDYAKGICIVLVVMMHSTLGVEKALGEVGYLGSFIAWARPFRMPDFFLISGLFLARRIDAPWPRYADTKIVHFAYFYVLWMTIQYALKGYGIAQAEGIGALFKYYALGFVEPFGTLWFIYLLAVFFAVTKLLKGVPAFAVFLIAAGLEAAPIETGSILIDEFCSRYVYFFAGHWLAAKIFRYAEQLGRIGLSALACGLAVWAAANAVLVAEGYAQLPGVSLAMGFAGAAAVVAMGVMLSRLPIGAPIRYLGAQSIVVYLAFFLFMAGSRTVLLRFAPGLGSDVISILVTLAGVVGPVLLHIAVRRNRLRFLFERPQWARVEKCAQGWHSVSHDTAQKLGEA